MPTAYQSQLQNKRLNYSNKQNNNSKTSSNDANKTTAIASIITNKHMNTSNRSNPVRERFSKGNVVSYESNQTYNIYFNNKLPLVELKVAKNSFTGHKTFFTSHNSHSPAIGQAQANSSENKEIRKQNNLASGTLNNTLRGTSPNIYNQVASKSNHTPLPFSSNTGGFFSSTNFNVVPIAAISNNISSPISFPSTKSDLTIPAYQKKDVLSSPSRALVTYAKPENNHNDRLQRGHDKASSLSTLIATSANNSPASVTKSYFWAQKKSIVGFTTASGATTEAKSLKFSHSNNPISSYLIGAFTDKTRSNLDALNMASHFTMPNKDIWKCLIAELIATALLIILGCGSILSLDQPKALNLTGIGLCWGFTVATLAQTFGHASGCHMNPAISLAMLFTGKMQLVKAGLYILVQCIGAMIGAAVLKALTPDNIGGNWGITTLGPNVTPLQGFGIEFMATFVLALVVFGVSDGNRNDVRGSPPLAIGLTIAALVFFAGPLTGASMNPVRSLGPSVVAGHWDNHWVYWIGPIAGAVTGAMIYQNVLRALSLQEIEAIQANEDNKQRKEETKENAVPTV